MQIIKFLSSLIITVGLVYFLSNPQTISGKKTPAFGTFLNPFSGFWQNASSLEEKANTTIDLEEVKGKVKVVYDDRLVPHIFAENDADLAFMQGYITAKHRLWQMEFQTHAIAGRLTELVGEKALEMDRENRRMGLPRSAQKSVEAWKKFPKTYARTQRYVDGINAYINSLQPKDLPIEYKLLGYEPEQWTMLKTSLFIKAMANTLARQDTDIEATNMLQALGRETFDFLYPEWFPEQSPIIPKGTKWDFTPVELPEFAKEKPKRRNRRNYQNFQNGFSQNVIETKQDEGLGSNNWAVAGSKTLSGNPILCGDPHLNLTLPSIWYEMQLSTPNYNVYGVTLPGIPSVIIGFNNYIAWSQTNVSRDLLDWYEITWEDDSKTAYLHDSTYRKVDIFVDTFIVRGGKMILDTIRYTHHGPVVFEDENNAKNGKALRWVAHDAPTTNELGVFQNLAKAKTYDDYVKAIENYHCPAQNYVFAAKNGDIAMWAQGTYPLKSKEQGRFVLNGSNSENDWHGFLPKSHSPHHINPTRGFVASANQHTTDPSFPYYYSGKFADYRGRYINRTLAKLDNIKIKDLMNLQNDNHSLFAEETLPLLLAPLDSTKLSKAELPIYNQLKKWNYNFEKELTTPTFFEKYHDDFYELLWDEVIRYKDTFPITTPENWRTTVLLRDQPNSEYFDILKTEKVETFSDLSLMAFQRAFKSFKDTIPTWSNQKSTNIRHLTGTALAPFSHENVAVGGSRFAPNANTGKTGPSWRMVVELGKEIKAYGVYPGGQSGNPGSPYYDNMIDKWKEGEYYELKFMKSSAEILGNSLLKVEVYN
jgi:penicillin amidase